MGVGAGGVKMVVGNGGGCGRSDDTTDGGPYIEKLVEAIGRAGGTNPEGPWYPWGGGSGGGRNCGACGGL